jgi:hypothetical protein
MIDALLNRLRKPKLQRDLREIFVPVIFANGQDNDLPGIIAAIENRAVQFDEKIYQPGEAIEISKRVLCLACDRFALIRPGSTPPHGFEHNPPYSVVIVEAEHPRSFIMRDCTFMMGWRPRA